MTAKVQARLDAVLAECLRHPKRCRSLADYMNDMSKDAAQWLRDARGEKERKSCREMKAETDLARDLLLALADVGEAS